MLIWEESFQFVVQKRRKRQGIVLKQLTTFVRIARKGRRVRNLKNTGMVCSICRNFINILVEHKRTTSTNTSISEERKKSLYITQSRRAIFP